MDKPNEAGTGQGDPKNTKQSDVKWKWFRLAVVLIVCVVAGVNTWLTGGSFILWLVVGLVASVLVGLIYELKDVICTQLSGFLKGSEGKSAQHFRGTMWFFALLIIAGLIAASCYTTCCETCEDSAHDSSTNSVATVNSNLTTKVETSTDLRPAATSSPLHLTNSFSGEAALVKSNADRSIFTTFESLRSHSNKSLRGQHLVTILFWSSACLAVGAFAGFLFGIPKIIQSADWRKDSKKEGEKEEETDIDENYRQQVNTNLTEISDWITKIIVGLGLVNLQVIPGKIHSTAEILAKSLQGCGPAEEHVAFALGVIVFFTVMGFLFGYLMTRLFLAAAFSRADREQNRIERESAKAEVASLKQKSSFLDFIIPTANPAATVAASARKQESGEPKGTPQPAKSPEELVKEAVAHGLAAHQIPDEKKRGDGKTEAANQIARLVVSGGITKDWLVQKIPEAELKQEQDPYIGGLAVIINSRPEPEDLNRLEKVALKAAWPNTRYKIADALGTLFLERCAFKEHVPTAEKILVGLSLKSTDESLQKRLRQTAALITRSTGVPIKFPDL